jgi:hypothetical protein
MLISVGVQYGLDTNSRYLTVQPTCPIVVLFMTDTTQGVVLTATVATAVTALHIVWL